MLKEYDALTSRINRLNELGIFIYDVVLRRKVNNFFENVSYYDVFEVNGESLIKKL